MENLKNIPELRDENIDIGIIGKGFISLYFRESVIDYDIGLLQRKKYMIVEFDCKDITSDAELHFAIQAKQNFLNYSGESFDALEDCLIDYEIDKNGVVMVFRHIDNLELKTICTLLDIMAVHARRRIAVGERLLILIQADDPKFKIVQPIGALNFRLWNDKEWFEADRLYDEKRH